MAMLKTRMRDASAMRGLSGGCPAPGPRHVGRKTPTTTNTPAIIAIVAKVQVDGRNSAMGRDAHEPCLRVHGLEKHACPESKTAPLTSCGAFPGY